MEVHWWIGVVENKKDPENRGRVQVRILGIHTNETHRLEQRGEGIPMADLPWAACMMPLTYGGTAESTVPPPAVMPGAWVVGISMDGDAYQKLLVLGVISMVMSPQALHTGANLNPIQYTSPIENISDDDACKDIYKKAVKNVIAKGGGEDKMQADNMMKALQYIKQKHPDKYQNFVNTSGVEIADNNVIAQGTQNDLVNKLLAEGYYNYCYEICEDPVLAALAYKEGLGKVFYGSASEKSYLEKYGDPRKNELSYESFANKLSLDGNTSGATFINDFVSELADAGMNRCVYKSSSGSPTDVKSVTNASGATSTQTDDLGTIFLPTQSNTITSLFMSANRPAGGSKKHMGIDLRAPLGSPIRSMAQGIVVDVIPHWGGVMIDHGSGIKTKYLHMRKTYVKLGDKITSGQVLGESGYAGLSEHYGAHLHFEVWKNNSQINPEDYLAEKGITFSHKAGA